MLKTALKLILKFGYGFLRLKYLFLVPLLILIFESNLFFSFNNFIEVTFLDVGQGDSILIRTPDYKYILIDAGEDERIVSRLGEVLPFWARKIDIFIGTHSDADHIGGFNSVFNKYRIEHVFLNQIGEEDRTVTGLKKLVEEDDGNFTNLTKGERIDVGDVHLDILLPDGGCEINENACSIVTKLSFGDFDFLLTGDIETAQEQKILRCEYLSGIEILKLAHHGSKTASSEEFIDAIDPLVAVISVGAGNKFKHPQEEVVKRVEDRKIKIYRTDFHGNIQFRYFQGQLKVITGDI